MSNAVEEYINSEEFKQLTEQERKEVLAIVEELSQKGKSDTLNSLVYEPYNEIPVTIEEFLTNDNYLGKAWKDVRGNSKLYPFWLETLKELFPTNVDTAYDTLLESGARGVGKSEIACGAVGAYLMYRVLCMKNPLEFYHLKPTEKIVFAFMNIKLDLAEAICESKFQKTIQMSPWFMARGKMTKKDNKPFWIPPDPIEIVIGSQSDDVIGQPIYFAFFDEISFLKNKDVEIQKQKALDMIDTAKGGMKTRFIHKGKNPTMLVVASSKRSEQSFMESYIKQLTESKDTKEKLNTYVVDKAVWEIKPKGTYSNEFFYVGLGNKFLDNIVIPRRDYGVLDLYKKKGYKLLEVPIDFESDAEYELERVLCDFAGISSFSSNKFLSAERVADIVCDTIANPLPDIIVCGNGKDDDTQYYDWWDWNNVPQELMQMPLFIHLDMSISGDKTGIGGTWIIGKKPSKDGSSGRDLLFRPCFDVSIKAPTGREISFEKNRQFIRWLRDSGFNIRAISMDTFQSADLFQQLESEGFECKILSVDRVEVSPGETKGICKPYQYLKSAIYEERLMLFPAKNKDEVTLLYEELTQLEINNTNGKIDHPNNGKTGSKDQADALCGSVYTASGYAEEFAYDFGEDLQESFEANQPDVFDDRKQMTVNFEEQLKYAFEHNPLRQVAPAPDVQVPQVQQQIQPPLDNGKIRNTQVNKPRTLMNNQYICDGILVW